MKTTYTKFPIHVKIYPSSLYSFSSNQVEQLALSTATIYTESTLQTVIINKLAINNQCMDRKNTVLIQVEESHNFSEIFGFLTSFHEQSTIVECKANHLLYM